jgi:RNA recognition motif-containing protein
MRLFLSNFPFETTADDLRDLLSDYGAPSGVRVMTDRETGRAKGFGFADMRDEEAARAISRLNGKDYGGRTLKVNEAKPRVSAGRERVA